MTNDTLQPFDLDGYTDVSERYIVGRPLANGVKENHLSTETTRVIIKVSEHFFNDGEDRIVIYQGNHVYGRGIAHGQHEIEILISPPFPAGPANPYPYTFYSSPSSEQRFTPLFFVNEIR
ncbi:MULTISPECIES: hypothetical protein [Serratia]|uniref:hypothetical protein n=1 Tax=Serratia TaxID=613 RepID=UPI0010224FED|nr:MULTISPECIES: hypothetical protein [Serratia]TXE64943.1 hypothetical protein FOT59_25650 [Serratia nevei]